MDVRGWMPPALGRPGELVITPWSYQSVGVSLTTTATALPSVNNWIAVGVAVFVPFWVPEPITVTKMFWANGSAVAGNIDAGIYDTAGTLLTSIGTTPQATISVTQTVDVADVTLARDTYYMAMVSDTSGVTQKVLASLPVAGILQSFGLLEQAGITLPLSTGASPATFAKYTRAFIPLFGLQAYRTIGPGI